MSPAELSCRCCLRIGDPALPVDPLQMLRLARATFVYTREQALAEGLPPEALPPTGPDNPANAFRQVTATGIDRWIVVWRPEEDAVRVRFSLAHELGHVALRHASGTRSPRDEAQADEFARALLMPAPVIRRLRREAGPLYAEQLTAVFGVALREARRLSGRPLPVMASDLEDAVANLYADAALSRMPPRVLAGWHRLSIL